LNICKGHVIERQILAKMKMACSGGNSEKSKQDRPQETPARSYRLLKGFGTKQFMGEPSHAFLSVLTTQVKTHEAPPI
jgi:hypothetical protein